jgi:hypothetical protein
MNRIHFRALNVLALVLIGLAAPAKADSQAELEEAESSDSNASSVSEGRSSGIELMLFGAANDYRNFRLGFDLGLDSDWQLNFNASQESSTGVDSAQSGGLGANTYLGDSWQLRFGLNGRREPNDVFATGFTGGLDWNVSDLWNAKLLSTISIDLSFTQYRQSTSRKGGRLLLVTVPLNSVTLGLSQQITQNIELFFNGTNYSYGSSTPEQLSAALSNRKISLTGLLQVVDGLPKSNVSLGTALTLGDWTLSPSIYRTTLAYDQTLTGLSVPIDWALGQHWTLSAEVAVSKSDGQSNGMFGLGARYSW